MTNLKRIRYVSVLAALLLACFAVSGLAQDRPRVIKPVLSQPTNQPTTIAPDRTRPTISTSPTSQPLSNPVLTNEIEVIDENRQKELIKKTSSSSPLNAPPSASSRGSLYNAGVTTAMMRAISSKVGSPYRLGATGPYRYDCSGFVWSVFADAGMNFTRGSARDLWATGIPVDGDERFKFGTLVFLNRLGHVGIVVDETGFYHASSSRGVMFSPFKGYWEKRIVGFRRLGTVPPASAAK